MSTTSSPNDLTSRPRHRLEADRQQIEETAARELERLGERLNAVARGALRSIERDTAEATAGMRALLLLKAWLAAAGGRSEPFFAASAAASWTTMHRLWRSIELRIEALARLDRQVEEARWTLDEIEETTWGVTAAGDRGRAVRGAAGPRSQSPTAASSGSNTQPFVNPAAKSVAAVPTVVGGCDKPPTTGDLSVNTVRFGQSEQS